MKRNLLLAATSFVAILAGQAHAEADAALDASVDTLIVTAQKREQSVKDVPIALTAYTGQFLEEIGVQEFEELSLFVPGFEVQNQSPNNPGFVMRGITSDSGEATNEPRVSVFQDGVSISKSRGSYVELFDNERIEIAKGPQSTLYGRGALIGAVNIVQAKAKTEAFAFAAKGEVGNYGYVMGEAMVNMPLSDTFAVRLSGRVKQRDGFVENLLDGDDFNSTDTRAGRIALRFAPNDRLNIDVVANYQEDSPSGTSFKSLTYAPTNPTTGAVIGDLGRNSGAALTSIAGFENNQPLGLERKVYGMTALADYKISDALTLSSITAYRRFEGTEVFDADGFSLPLFVFAEVAWGRQTSQELRLAYDNGGKVTAFAGVSYFHENGSQRVPLSVNEKVYALVSTGQLPKPNGLPLPAILNLPALAALKADHREAFANYGETTSYDYFADATWRPMDRLELTAGIRYTQDDKTSGYSAVLMNGGSVLGGSTPTVARGLIAQPTPGGKPQYSSLDDDGITYRAVARYAATDNISLYASYARGRRPKVLGVAAPTTPGGNVRYNILPGEVVDSIEVGAKGEFLDRTLTLEGSVYDYQYDNFQTSIRNDAGQVVSINAGKASAYGFEGQANWRPNPNTRLFATYGYNHARFDIGLFEGNSFRLSPDHSTSVGAKVDFPMMQGKLSVTPTYTWQSKVFFDNNNDRPDLQSADKIRDEFQKAYGLLNLRVSYAPENGGWELGAFANNILEQDYIKDAGNTGDGFGIATFIAGEPRYYGVSLTIRR